VRRADPFSHAAALAQSVYAYAAYRLGPGHAAEDVTAEAFARGLRARETYDPARGRPEAWLIGIARRVIAEHMAQRELPVAEVADRPGPDDHEDRALERITLSDAMRALPDRDRELLALRYGADLTAAQIGQMLDMRTNAVEVALHRALERLRGTMVDETRPLTHGDAAYGSTG
jgi:RNA polymerase sigma factor (sigma-70 family)